MNNIQLIAKNDTNNLMNNIQLIAKIVDYDSAILYNFLCVDKNINNELLDNITVLCLLNNTKIEDDNLKLFERLVIQDYLIYL